jgi:hypothetical protein
MKTFYQYFFCFEVGQFVIKFHNQEVLMQLVHFSELCAPIPFGSTKVGKWE